MNRRLVVVRAGDASLHPQWLTGTEPPTFELAVSYYGDDPNAFSDSVTRHAVKGGKWDGLHAFFASNPSVLDEYDWIWLPDDDIATTTPVINRLFDLMEEHALHIAQPSLTWDSYYSHFITLQNPRFRVRWTNFVEVMVPAFSSRMLRRILPAFAGSRSGWGLDWLWARWVLEPAYRTAIIDSIAVRHTRPMGRGNLGRTGATAERDRIMNMYPQVRPQPVVYAGLDMRGHVLRRGLRLLATLHAGWKPLCREVYATGHFPIKARKLNRRVLRMVLSRMDLTPLPPPTGHIPAAPSRPSQHLVGKA